MNMRCLLSLLVIAVLTFVPSFVLTGCESDDSPNTDGLDSYFTEHPFVSDPRTSTFPGGVSISPDSATISAAGQQVAFTASGGRGVYTWDVSRPGNGTVEETGDGTAVYTASVVGANDVIVYDADGKAALATLTGPTSDLVVTANPDELAASGDLSILTASGGVPPYTWAVGDPWHGDFVSGSGSSRVYERANAGDNYVIVTDSAGSSYSVVIYQP